MQSQHMQEVRTCLIDVGSRPRAVAGRHGRRHLLRSIMLTSIRMRRTHGVCIRTDFRDGMAIADSRGQT